MTALCRVVVLLFTVEVCLVAPVSAQYHFDSWNTENGLPHNAINAITQTRDGYLWLATPDGLVRYDGVRFTIFNTANTPGIKSNRCTSLFEDRTGQLWIGTEDGGLTTYHDGAFRTYTAEQGLPGNMVRRVWADASEQTVLLIGNQFFRWQDGSAEPYGIVPTEPPNNDFSNQQTGRVWYKEGSRLNIIKKSGTIVLTPADGLSSLDVTAIYEDRQGVLWIGTKDNRLNRVKDGVVTVFPIPDGRTDDYVRTIAEDHLGNIWLAVGRSGLFRWNNGKFVHYSTTKKASEDIILTIYEDHEGTLWIGSAHGLNRLSRDVVSVYSDENGLPGNNVYPIFQDHTGDVWLGVWPNGLARYRDGRFTVFTNKDGLTSQLLTAIAEDRDGGIWVGGYHCLERYKDGHFTDLKAMIAPQVGYVSAILPDSSGALWFGTDKGLILYKDGTTTFYTTKDGLAGEEVKVILQDRKGTIWAGSYGGLAHYLDGRWQAITRNDGLGGDKVRALYEDTDGLLWVGTYDGGLSRIKEGKITNFTTKDGLYNNGVFQILEDDRGNFWLSCNLGIYRVSKQQLNDFADGRTKFITSVVYGSRDGLTDIECNGGTQPAGCRTRDGRLWFPTQGGAAIIDPNEIPINPKPPPVVIEGCVLDRTDVVCRQGITISPGQQNLEINYTGLSFVKPEQIRFKYKVTGLDDDWIDAGTRRTAYFPHLPPGTYTFTVIAANSDGVWNNQGQSLQIVVVPPFWRTWWFLSLMAIVVIAMMLFVYRRRVFQLQRKHAIQQAFSRQLIESQETERKRISAELHDSLGQSLAIIKNHALFGLQGTADLELTREQLRHISEQSAHAIDEVKEISYNLRPYLLDRLGLTKAIESMLSRVAESSEIDFTVKLDDVNEVFSPEDEINFYRIIQECVNNIVKHSGASSAVIKVEKDAHAVKVTIQDNGKGFVADTLGSASHGFGLVGIAERVRMLGGRQTINSSPGQGTVITITLNLREKSNGKHDAR